MLNATELAGFVGAGVAGTAYVLQVALGAWLAASLLAATALIVIDSTKYAHSYCAIHLPPGLELQPATALPLEVAILDDVLYRSGPQDAHEGARVP